MAGGINVINGVRNAGNMPAISAGPTTPTTATVYQLFVSTFDNVLYYWNGTGWQPLGGGGHVPPLTDVLTAGNSGSVGQQINLFAGDIDHQVTLTGNQIIFKNGSGLDIGTIRSDLISGLNTYVLPSRSGTFLLNNNFIVVTGNLISGQSIYYNSAITTSSTVQLTHYGNVVGSQYGILSYTVLAGQVNIVSYKPNGTIETGDNNQVTLQIYI